MTFCIPICSRSAQAAQARGRAFYTTVQSITRSLIFRAPLALTKIFTSAARRPALPDFPCAARARTLNFFPSAARTRAHTFVSAAQ